MSYMSKSKAVELINACLDELYRSSSPSISWKEVQDKYKHSKEAFYLNYYIPEELYSVIVDKYRKLIPKLYHNDFDWFLLDYVPTTVERKKE